MQIAVSLVHIILLLCSKVIILKRFDKSIHGEFPRAGLSRVAMAHLRRGPWGT